MRFAALSFRRGPVLWATAAMLAVSVGALATATPSRPTLALINESPSVPKGLYLRSLDQEPRLGRLVAIPQPSTAQMYLAELGVPSEVRLLKRIAAVGGDKVCAQDGQLRTPNGATVTPSHDRRGVALPVWRACRALASDELLLLGDTPTSFDGRYFGPVRLTQVEGVYTEVLRW